MLRSKIPDSHNFLFPVKNIHCQADQSESHDAVRHRPADVVRVHAEYYVSYDQVAELKDEEKDRWNEGTLEEPDDDVVHQDAYWTVN